MSSAAITDAIQDEKKWFETTGKRMLALIDAANDIYITAVKKQHNLDNFKRETGAKGYIKHVWDKVTKSSYYERITDHALKEADTLSREFYEVLNSRANRLFNSAMQASGLTDHFKDTDYYTLNKLRMDTLKKMDMPQEYLDRLSHSASWVKKPSPIITTPGH